MNFLAAKAANEYSVVEAVEMIDTVLVKGAEAE